LADMKRPRIAGENDPEIFLYGDKPGDE
jgi:hypothetical protein